MRAPKANTRNESPVDRRSFLPPLSRFAMDKSRIGWPATASTDGDLASGMAA